MKKKNQINKIQENDLNQLLENDLSPNEEKLSAINKSIKPKRRWKSTNSLMGQ